MKMDEFRKAIINVRFDCLRAKVDAAEFYMTEIMKRKEMDYRDALFPLVFQLGRVLGELESFDLPDWSRAYRSYNLFTEYKYRVIAKIRNFYYDEM